MSERLSLREIPQFDQPRERLKHLGAQALSSAELLAIILGSGSRGRSALHVAQDVLASAGGSLRRISAQPVAALSTRIERTSLGEDAGLLGAARLAWGSADISKES